MHALIVGRGGPEVEEILGDAGLRTQVAPDEASARALLVEPSPIRLVLLDSEVDAAFVAWLREDARLFALPVIALLSPEDARPGTGSAGLQGAFHEAFARGCDDAVLRPDGPGLAHRAASAARQDPTRRPPPAHGSVLVCGTSLDRRQVLGRLIRMAGFDVTFTEGTADVPPGPFRFAVVAVPKGSPDPAALVDPFRTGQPDLPIVLIAAPEDGSRLTRLARPLPSVAVTTQDAPAHDVLYLANEVLRARLPEVRRSPRLLAEALCSFRPEGEVRPGLGITHTMSANGLYIRTLDAPAAGARVWIELRPDGDTRLVHLRGDVVWTRAFGEPVGVYSPPGFGVALDLPASPTQDRRLFAVAYRKRLRTV